MGELLNFFPPKLVGVCAGFRNGELVAAVAAVTIRHDDGLVLEFPKANPFEVGQSLTVHLDDRVGSELYSVELKVHRTSYKGTVASVVGNQGQVRVDDYDLFYGTRVVAKGRAPDYRHPLDGRPVRLLTESPLRSMALADESEVSNHLGVLITRAPDRPHTTVMAFLSGVEDDIFLITDQRSFKYQLLTRDPGCAFALDHRATFSFERRVEWNYTIYETRAHRIDRTSGLFAPIQREFIQKNPWETVFFSSPDAVLIHLAPSRIIHQDILGH